MSKFTNVLLVEDDPITIMVCDKMIAMHDFSTTVSSCFNGKEALDYLMHHSDQTPDVIFLDINMPIMNGWDFLEELEQHRHNFTQIPRIYILSSTVDPEDYRRAKNYPLVLDFVSKPLSKEALDSIAEGIQVAGGLHFA